MEATGGGSVGRLAVAGSLSAFALLCLLPLLMVFACWPGVVDKEVVLSLGFVDFANGRLPFGGFRGSGS